MHTHSMCQIVYQHFLKFNLGGGVQKNEKISGDSINCGASKMRNVSKNSSPKKARTVKNSTKQTASAKKSKSLFHALFPLIK